jgi:hypothetical protein
MRKITIVLTILLFSLVTIHLSATNVSGLISTNTTWTKGNSPYIVTNNILVNTGVTLTIDPGVTIKFDTLKSMQIDGELLAQGTSSNKITFTSNTTQTAGAWGYIYFSDVSTDAAFDIHGAYVSGSILEYCTIQYAGGANVTDNGALRLNAAYPFINYCTITENNATGIHAYNLTGMLKISNCSINHNISPYTGGSSNGGGIYIIGNGNSNTLITGNTISNNTASSGGGIEEDGGGGTCVISNNIISYNTGTSTGGGIEGNNKSTIANNIIMNNTTNIPLTGCEGGGIDVGSSSVSDNLIINNSAGRNGGGIINDGITSHNVIADNSSIGLGGGVYNLYYCTILNNHIIRNTAVDGAGVHTGGQDIEHNTIVNNRNTNLNNLQNTSLYILGNPQIDSNNIFNNSTFYELYNSNVQGTPNLAATNNWWGTADDGSIQTKIYDWFDDNTLGIVNYSPFLITPDTLAPVSPPANVSKTNIGGGQVKITWDKNPESDIAGYHVYYGGFTGYSFTNMINVAGKAVTSYILTGVPVTDTIAVTAYDRTYNIANELDSTITNDNMTNGNESWFTYAKAPCNSITLTMSANDASCSTCNDGKATATVSLGLSPYTYSWNTSPAQVSSTAVNLLPGTYIVTITDANGCSLIDSAAVSFPNGIKETKSSTIAIYPNPASDIITLNIDNINNAGLTLNIYNVIGTLVKSETLGQNQRQINIADLPNGVYFATIKSNNTRKTEKLIIQR